MDTLKKVKKLASGEGDPTYPAPYLVRIGRSVGPESGSPKDHQLAKVYNLQTTKYGLPGHRGRVNNGSRKNKWATQSGVRKYL